MQNTQRQNAPAQAPEFDNPFERLLGGSHTLGTAPTVDLGFAALLEGTVTLHKAPPKARKVKEILGTLEMEVMVELETIQSFCAACFKLECSCNPRTTVSMKQRARKTVTQEVVVATEIVWE